ncbi:MAG: DMT family transporter [Candidatus Thorarchaeota archaeon]|nr:MAG: DMT family transporter [Candidatus Thorarchaeota archaeon]
MTEDPRTYYILMIVAMFFWGGSWVSAKIIVAMAPPLTIGFFRFLIAGILFALLLPAMDVKPWKLINRDNVKILFLAGLTGVFGYGVLFLTGMRFTTAAQGSIIAGFNPASVSLFAHIIHGERLSRRWQYSGFALAFAGVVFVVGVQALIDFQLEHLVGNLIIAGAMLMWGLYSSIGKEAMKTMSATEVTAGGVVFGCVLFGLGALTEEVWSLPALYDPIFWINVLYLGALVTFVAFLFYFESIKNLGATRTGGFINLVPVFGTMLSVLILHEQIYWTFVLGIALVILGIVTINLQTRNAQRAADSAGHPEDR